MELVEKHNIPNSPRMALCLELLLTKEVNKQKREGERWQPSKLEELQCWKWLSFPRSPTHNKTPERRPLHLSQPALSNQG